MYAESMALRKAAMEPPPPADNRPKAAAGGDLRKYLDIGLGGGTTNLTAMNYSRKKLSDRINTALKSAGIELKGDEKLAISVNEIVVGGIKDKAKARKIEEALNKDKALATEMRNHVAAGKINENAAKQELYEKYLADNGLTDSDNLAEKFTSPAIRSYVMNEYLTQNAGLGLEDLTVDYGEDGSMAIVGGDERLSALLSQDEQLGVTIGAILENGETETGFNVSFEFANGAITDPHSKDMAKSKVDGINKKLFNMDGNPQDWGVADKFREQIAKFGPIDNKELEAALSRGFSIRIKEGGDFEIAGLDGLDKNQRATLESLVRDAMEEWVADDKYFNNAMDGGTARKASLADVYDAYMEEHQFEHGDTGEHLHEIEISFGGGAQVKAVSPDADEAQQEENGQLALQLGDSLRFAMKDEGMDVTNMELEIDDKGKITVSGDMSKAELEQAQQFVDQFMAEATAGSFDKKKPGDEEDEARAEREREAVHSGDEEDAQEKPANIIAWANGNGKDEAPDADRETLKRIFENDELNGMAEERMWKQFFPETFSGVWGMGKAKEADFGVKPPRYVDNGSGKADNLYRMLLNGMQNFHEQPNSLRYAM